MIFEVAAECLQLCLSVQDGETPYNVAGKNLKVGEPRPGWCCCCERRTLERATHDDLR